MEHLHLGLALGEQLLHGDGQVILCLHRIPWNHVFQEIRKPGGDFRDKAAGEAPEIHGHSGVLRHVHPAFPAVLGIVDAAGVLFNAGALVDARQQAVSIYLALSPGHTAVVGNGLAQLVAHHGIMIFLPVLSLGKEVIDHPESVFSVIIVGIDDRKGRIADFLSGAQHTVAGAPGLLPLRRDGIALGEHLVHLLIGIANLHGTFFQAAAHRLHEILPNGFFNDNNGRFKPGLMGIIQGIVQNGFPVGAHRIDLLQSAVAAAHTGGHHHQDRLFHNGDPPFCVRRPEVASIWSIITDSFTNCNTYPPHRGVNTALSMEISSFRTRSQEKSRANSMALTASGFSSRPAV